MGPCWTGVTEEGTRVSEGVREEVGNKVAPASNGNSDENKNNKKIMKIIKKKYHKIYTHNNNSYINYINNYIGP